MVPEGWKKKRLSDLADVTSGGTPSRTKSAYWGGDIPWVTTAEIRNGTITDTQEKITASGLANSSAKLFPKGTILLAMYGEGKTRGQVALLGIDAATNQACAAILPKENVSGEYLYHNLLGRYEEIRSLSNDGSQKNLSGGLVKSISILQPPRCEQEKIARLLMTWDRAIDNVESLIQNSEAQKRALMQKLLTATIRFERFARQEWRHVRLQDIAEVLVSNVDKKSDPAQRSVRLCNYTDVYYNVHITSHLDFMMATATKSQIDKFSLRKGDVIITKDSETPDDIAVAAVVEEDLPGVLCGYHLALLRPHANQTEGAFLRSLFSLKKTQHYFFTRANGATRFGLTIDAIREAQFFIPPIEEQQGIAQVLRACERTIENYKDQLARLKQQKKALMQKLLTGKLRVKAQAA